MWPRLFLAALVAALWATSGLGVPSEGVPPFRMRETHLLEPLRILPHAPEFPRGLQWLNVNRPLELQELRGKVVLLHFWISCCAHSANARADLGRLAAQHGNVLAVIGVRASDCRAETTLRAMRQAVMREGVDYPVIDDSLDLVSRRYGVRAWPTVVVIAPDGRIVGSLSGEGLHDSLDRIIRRTAAAYERSGELNLSPVLCEPERRKTPATALSFPTAVCADEASGRIAIADSGHHRLVVTGMDGNVLDVVGQGPRGFRDGPFEEAQFDSPSGLAMRGDVLYVADTGNHAIRRVDLTRRTVLTLAGTGGQATQGYRPELELSGVTPLNAPRGLLLHDDTLYIAMTGQHQIWRMDLSNGRLCPVIGTGCPGHEDGPPQSARLEQPTALAMNGQVLYFTEGQPGALRAADAMTESVATVLSTEWPDATLRLHHPLGMASRGNKLYVADSCNQRILSFHPASRVIETLAGGPEPGLTDGHIARFNHPAGMSAAGDVLYVADTNNHCVRVVNIASRFVSTLRLRGIEKLAPPAAESEPRIQRAFVEHVAAPGDCEMEISVKLPRGYQLHSEAAPAFHVRVEGDGVRLRKEAFAGAGQRATLPLRLPLALSEGKARVTVDMRMYCVPAGQEGPCLIEDMRLVVPLRVSTEADTQPIRVDCAITEW